jgi:hypothetical protein
MSITSQYISMHNTRLTVSQLSDNAVAKLSTNSDGSHVSVGITTVLL